MTRKRANKRAVAVAMQAIKKKKPATTPASAPLPKSVSTSTAVQVSLEAPETVKEEQQAVPATFLIEKHRYTKGRINTRVAQDDDAAPPPLCSRFGPHYIKTTFLLDCSNRRAHATIEERNLWQEYDRLCAFYRGVDWQVNKTAMEACAMTVAECRLAAASKRQQGNATSTTVEPAAAMIPIEENVKGAFDAHVAVRRRKRVLVPFSGGLSSMATLWWCLLQDYDVYLCYAFAALDATPTIAEKPAEIECLLRLLQYARTRDGTLLFDRRDQPEAGVHQLTRAEISERIRIVQVPQSAYNLPNGIGIDIRNQEPFASDVQGERCKAHPQAYLLLYRHLITVAASLQCTGIAMGMHGDARQLLTSASKFFAQVYAHDLQMPFASRTEALVCFQEAATQSWHVWKSYFLRREQQEDIDGVWQTCGPALMPNTSHYVSTCSNPARPALQDVLLQAQLAAFDRVQCLIADEAEKEQGKIDAALARGEKLRKKRAPDPLQHTQYLAIFMEEKARLLSKAPPGLFHFCNQCLDCAQWREITAVWERGGAARRIAPQWQNLFCEYLARIEDASLHSKPLLQQQDQTIIINAQPEVQPTTMQQPELTLADLPAAVPATTGDESSDEFMLEENDDDEEEAADDNVVAQPAVTDVEELDGTVAVAEDGDDAKVDDGEDDGGEGEEEEEEDGGEGDEEELSLEEEEEEEEDDDDDDDGDDGDDGSDY